MSMEAVIGLEIHVELATKSKIFCSCTTEFGGEPNTHCCPVCTGMPGTLPVFNKKVLEYSVKAGLALNCQITKYNKFDRKNYFYPDLPKAYQISQLFLPFARNGFVDIGTKKIGIHEIHMEEDAGKLIHSVQTGETFTDYNRCGVPLIEIVTEPDFRSTEEVTTFLTKIKSIFEYLGISDCKMQEGSMRVDVNISVKEKSSNVLGTRTEMKNLNSFRGIERAIKAETKRQTEVISCGGVIVQETRRWDDSAGESYSMRSKENAEDYRYFPEPDIPPISISDDYITNLKDNMPEFAQQKALRYVNKMGLSEADAEIIASSKHLAWLFEETVKLTDNPKEIRFWIINQIMYFINEKGLIIEDCKLTPQKFREFVKVVLSDKVNRQTGKKVFEELVFSNEGFDIEDYITKNGLVQVDDEHLVRKTVIDIFASNSKTVEQYKAGQTKVAGFFVGQVMKTLRGTAKPETVNKIVSEELKKL